MAGIGWEKAALESGNAGQSGWQRSHPTCGPGGGSTTQRSHPKGSPSPTDPTDRNQWTAGRLASRAGGRAGGGLPDEMPLFLLYDPLILPLPRGLPLNDL